MIIRSKTRVFFTLMLLGMFLGIGPAYAADKKPNILVIMSDDVGITNISA